VLIIGLQQVYLLLPQPITVGTQISGYIFISHVLTNIY